MIRYQDKKLLEISKIDLNKSTFQIFWYTCLDAGLDISLFRGVMASPMVRESEALKVSGHRPRTTTSQGICFLSSGE